MSNKTVHQLYPAIIVFFMLLVSCSTPGPAGLFGKRSPHESYAEKISNAGLKETALGRSWLNAAEESLKKTLSVTIPYSEAGYFSPERPEAVGVRFKAVRGEKLNISVTKKPAAGFSVYMDLWEAGVSTNDVKWLMAADTSNQQIAYEVKKDGYFVVRLQPELLAAVEYILTINSGPSLAFPVPEKASPRIGSFWGASRDNGGRKHEGIDIFAPKRTPVVAVADGVVSNSGENNLGGKVVFLRPHNKDYTLYYAHLDEQLVSTGQRLKTGDTLGLVGNTGNARTTPPHLHFGIYTFGGAIDPLPFVKPSIEKPAKITAAPVNIGKMVRTGSKATRVYGDPATSPSNYVTLEANTLVRVQAATSNWYKVILPNGQQGYIASNAVTSLEKPLRKVNAAGELAITNGPDTGAPSVVRTGKGDPINILAAFNDHYYVDVKNEEGWIPKALVK